ncbi:MAG: DUF503 family protein [Dehalococcoidia bacterium]|nr:DUF503 family protein [Dehalococcoidia bacterium]
MYVGACLVRLSIPGARSLKDKRQVVRSLLDRSRAKFGVSAAEVADNEAWQYASLGFSSVSNDHAHAEEVLNAVVPFIENLRPDVEVLSVTMEVSRLDP